FLGFSMCGMDQEEGTKTLFDRSAIASVANQTMTKEQFFKFLDDTHLDRSIEFKYFMSLLFNTTNLNIVLSPTDTVKLEPFGLGVLCSEYLVQKVALQIPQLKNMSTKEQESKKKDIAQYLEQAKSIAKMLLEDYRLTEGE